MYTGGNNTPRRVRIGQSATYQSYNQKVLLWIIDAGSNPAVDFVFCLHSGHDGKISPLQKNYKVWLISVTDC